VLKLPDLSDHELTLAWASPVAPGGRSWPAVVSVLHTSPFFPRPPRRSW